MRHFNVVQHMFLMYIVLSIMLTLKCKVRGRVMVSMATFNNISVISWRSVLLVEKSGVPGENRCCIKYRSMRR